MINKNRAHNGVYRREANDLIVNILKIRKTANKRLKGGRKYIALTKNAETVLLKG